MRKNSLFKRTVAIALAGTLAFGNLISAVAGVTNASVDRLGEVTLPEPNYTFDFESALADTQGLTAVKSAAGSVEIVEDAQKGKVLHITDGGTAVFGENYLKLPEDVFKNVTADTGASVSMWVKLPETLDHAWSVLFSSTPTTYNEWNLWKVNANLVSGVNGGNPHAWGDSNAHNLARNTWHHVTITLDKTDLKVYADGVQVSVVQNANAAHTDGFTGMLAQAALNKFNVLGAGGFPDGEKTGDKDIADCYYDDVAFYATALTAEQIKSIYDTSVVKVESITITPATATVSNSYVYASEEDKNNGTIATSELGSIQLSATVAPETAFVKDFTWSIAEADKDKATVDTTGKVTLTNKVQDGDTVTVNATASDGSEVVGTCTITASVTETIESKKVTAVSVSDQTLLLGYDNAGKPLGKSVTLQPVIEPADADVKDVVFTTANSDIVAIEGNTITALKVGEATVTVTSKSSSKVSSDFKVTVKQGTFGELTSDFTAESFGSANSGNEKMTGDFNINYTFTNKTKGTNNWDNFVFELTDGTNWQTLRADAFALTQALGNTTWTGAPTDWAPFKADMQDATVTVCVSRQEDIIEVNMHVVGNTTNNTYDIKAVVEGTNIADTLYMHITGENVEISNIKLANSAMSLDKTELELNTGSTGDITLAEATVPSTTVIKNAVSSDEKIATVKVVDGKVTVTGVKAGTATITVEASNGMSQTCKVTVTDVVITGIELSKAETTIEKGKTETITATIKPAGATAAISWTSGNTSVATVDSKGVITAVGPGTADITAAVGEIKAVCKVTVVSPLTGIELSKAELTLENKKLGENVTFGKSTLTVTYTPADTTDDKTVTWTSGDNKIATVDSKGVVTAVAESGSTTITAAVGKFTKTCKVTITTTEIKDAVYATGVTLDKSTAQVEAGKTVQLTAAITPDNASIKECDWTSSDETVATVDTNGLVTALKAGKTTIKATTKDGTNKSAECTVTVTAAKVAVTGVTLDKTSVSLEEGAVQKLTATVAPTNATVKDVTWSSDTPAVATVDKDGNVKAIAAGTAKIKVTSNDNAAISAVCDVTVTAKQTENPNPGGDKPGTDKPGTDKPGTPVVKPTLTLNRTSATLYTGKASKSVIVKSAVTGTSKAVKWNSKNRKVATVLNGKITAVKAGKTTITATANGITKTVNITVKNPTITMKQGKKNFKKSKLTVKKKKSVTLKISVKPAKSGISIGKLTKKQKKIATVKFSSKSGKLTIKGKKKGKFTITIKSGKASKKIKLTVK